MKVLVCGGRDYHDYIHLSQTLLSLFPALKDDDLIISGGAPGADRMAEQFAKDWNIPIVVVRAEWETYGKRAGYLRNVKMADLVPDLVVAFPGGEGTAMMVRIAEERGIPVKKVA